MNLLFAASGQFAVPTLRALLASGGHELLQVVSQPDKPSGRGRRLAPTPVSQFAMANNLPLLRTENINNEQFPPADLLIVIAFGQKIAPPIVHHARLGSINLHASLLPKYRGAAPINHAILNGETVTGNSIIRLAEKMDAGAVLAQSRLPIDPLETAGELHDRLAEDGAPLVSKTIESLSASTATESPQDDSQATLAPKLTREATIIDWNENAQAIANQIRGLYPWPGCRVLLIDSSGKQLDQLTLVRAFVSSQSPGGPGDGPGIINQSGSIPCNNGQIEIFELQPQGKQPMPLSAYRNGHPWPPGARLQSIT